MKLLNLGCGTRYHTSWTNVDFTSSDSNVLGHNLLKGIPFADNSFDVVYHSHVLEHFSKEDGLNFIRECFRVLKSNGTIRVAVPNLERIAIEYLRNLELASNGNKESESNYDWIILEMLDQMTRKKSGGEMAKYLFRSEISNEDYVFERIGEEGRSIRSRYLNSIDELISPQETPKRKMTPAIYSISNISGKIKSLIKHLFFYQRNKQFEILQQAASIGKFQLGGEIHQWMYDRYSLPKLLSEVGFSEIKIRDAFTSTIPLWNNYELESKNGVVYKPDSLFIEAIK